MSSRNKKVLTARKKKVAVYPREAILDLAEMAALMRTIPEQVVKMDLPCFYVTRQRREGMRFIYGQVLDQLEKRAKENAA